MNSPAQLDFSLIFASAAFPAREFHFIAKQAVSELVETGWTAPLHNHFAVGGFVPWLELNQRVRDAFVVGRAFDGISNGREENVGVRALHVLDGLFDILQLFSLVAPHQKHSCLDATCFTRGDGGLHLFDGYAALHGVEDSLRTALGADPDAETSK